METLEEQLIIRHIAVLCDALVRMTGVHLGVVFVVDEMNHLEGVISDGDVRRALLSDVSLNTPVSKIMNLNPRTADSLEQAKTILCEHPALLAVPVLKAGGYLTAFVALNEDHTFRVVSVEPETPIEAAHKKANVLALIPARGNSKRIPKKNLSRIGSKTLLQLAIETVRNASTVDEVMVSSDDAEIIEHARGLGVTVPWRRPAELATDEAKSVDVAVHAFERFRETHQYLPEVGLLIEPTAPLRTSAHIDQAVRALQQSDADCVMTISPVPHNFHPEELLRLKGDQVVPYLAGRTMDNRRLRGEQETVYVPNGAAYAFRPAILLDTRSLFGSKTIGVETGPETFLDIDTKRDLQLAQFLVKEKI